MNISKRMKNCFLKQIFVSVNHFMQGALFCHPEKFILSPMWDNKISRNVKPLKSEVYRAFSTKILNVANLFDAESGKFLSKAQLDVKFGINLPSDFYLEMKFILKSAKRYLCLPEDALFRCFKPMQPLLIQIQRL